MTQSKALYHDFSKALQREAQQTSSPKNDRRTISLARTPNPYAGAGHGGTNNAEDIGEIFLPSLQGHDVGNAQKGEISRLVKTLMRRVPHPVAIITSAENVAGKSEQSHNSNWRGATVSSFNTVSIEPDVIVSFNLKTPSATFRAIQSSGSLTVHLLGGTAEAGELATLFTSGNSEAPFAQLENLGVQAEAVAESGDSPVPTSPPRIISFANATQAPHFTLVCRYMREKTVELGDHVVCFGVVTRIMTQSLHENERHVRQGDQHCLIYAEGRYCRVVGLDLQGNPVVSTKGGNIKSHERLEAGRLGGREGAVRWRIPISGKSQATQLPTRQLPIPGEPQVESTDDSPTPDVWDSTWCIESAVDGRTVRIRKQVKRTLITKHLYGRLQTFGDDEESYKVDQRQMPKLQMSRRAQLRPEVIPAANRRRPRIGYGTAPQSAKDKVRAGRQAEEEPEIRQGPEDRRSAMRGGEPRHTPPQSAYDRAKARRQAEEEEIQQGLNDIRSMMQGGNPPSRDADT